jgi:hypothetical protein
MVIHAPMATKTPGTSGQAKLTTFSFCQSGRRCRNTKMEATASIAVKFRVMPT